MPSLSGVDRRLLGRLPPFSPIAVRLLAALADERASFLDISRLIALDPVLAGEVLRLANSGLYGRRFEVRSVPQAIAMLGSGKISQIAVTATLWRGLPRRAAPFVRDWWRHNLGAALVATHCSKDDPVDCAYTPGLLHGVGQLALFADAPDEYPDLIERAYTEELDLLHLEQEAFGIDHAALSRLLLECWGLPKEFCEVVARHHSGGSGSRLALAVQTGCVGAEYAGFGRCGCHLVLREGVPHPLEEMLATDYLTNSLVADVNKIECSLV